MHKCRFKLVRRYYGFAPTIIGLFQCTSCGKWHNTHATPGRGL